MPTSLLLETNAWDFARDTLTVPLILIAIGISIWLANKE